jgi:uncharacterized membrane protein
MKEMSFQEKKSIAPVISTVLVLIAYFAYVWLKHQAGLLDPEYDLKFWATTMLIFIGIGVVSNIVILIIFHMVNAAVNEIRQEEEDCSMVEDEMDKLIELKATRNSYIVAGVGFVIALVSLVLEKTPAVMLNVLFLSFHMGFFTESFSKLYFYRRGIKHG